jgi:hypothetical protein
MHIAAPSRRTVKRTLPVMGQADRAFTFLSGGVPIELSCSSFSLGHGSLPPMKREFLVNLNREFESNLLFSASQSGVSASPSLGNREFESALLRHPVLGFSFSMRLAEDPRFRPRKGRIRTLKRSPLVTCWSYLVFGIRALQWPLGNFIMHEKKNAAITVVQLISQEDCECVLHIGIWQLSTLK